MIHPPVCHAVTTYAVSPGTIHLRNTYPILSGILRLIQCLICLTEKLTCGIPRLIVLCHTQTNGKLMLLTACIRKNSFCKSSANRIGSGQCVISATASQRTDKHRQKTCFKKPLSVTVADQCQEKPASNDHKIAYAQTFHTCADSDTKLSIPLSVIIIKSSHTSVFPHVMRIRLSVTR